VGPVHTFAAGDDALTPGHTGPTRPRRPDELTAPSAAERSSDEGLGAGR
jgi:DNA polymerase IV